MFFQKIKSYFQASQKHYSDIPLDECVHYCAFRYTSKFCPPYERYIRKLHQGQKEFAANCFIEFLRYYRPTSMQEALGIKNPMRQTALWRYPWDYNVNVNNLSVGWSSDPNDVPDIMTHFSKEGILKFRILEEFCWLESSYYNMKKYSFQDNRSKDSCRVLCLENIDGSHRFIVQNGNHRIAALSCLGKKSIKAEITRVVKVKDLKKWSGVTTNAFSFSEAQMIFNAYFQDKFHDRTTSEPAKIIEDI